MTIIGRFIGGAIALLVAACSPVVLLNATVPRGGYSVKHDLAYGTAPRQNLDLYVPDGLKAAAPVVLFFYGGNWDSGSKAYYLALGQAFASAGVIVAVADYRLYPDIRYPVFLEDCARAFQFVHANAARFGGDPGRIFLMGHSAGAYNAVMLASDPHYLRDAGADISQVKGVVGIAGPYDFLPLTDSGLMTMFGGANRPETQPITHIDGKRPPMLLVAGSADKTVSPNNTVNMAARLRSFGSEAETIFYPGIGHVGIILTLAPPFRFRAPLRTDILRFIRAH
jgi:acetyl esterase/lipase